MPVHASCWVHASSTIASMHVKLPQHTTTLTRDIPYPTFMYLPVTTLGLCHHSWLAIVHDNYLEYLQ